MNSAHQLWSEWTYRVYPGETGKKPPFQMVKANCAKFGRLMFGSASQMHVRHATDPKGLAFWEIAVLTEGHPAHEAPYVEWMHSMWRKFFEVGFGRTCDIRSSAKVKAGDRQDGTPADQLILLPGITLHQKVG